MVFGSSRSRAPFARQVSECCSSQRPRRYRVRKESVRERAVTRRLSLTGHRGILSVIAIYQQPQRPTARLEYYALIGCTMELPERVSSRLIVCSALGVIAFAAIPTVGQSTAQEIHPVLRLRSRITCLGNLYGSGCVEASGPIPVDLRKPCSLTIESLTANTDVQTISWPLDGNPSSGWSGG